MPIGLLGVAVGPVDCMLKPLVVRAEPGVRPGDPSRRSDTDDHGQGGQGRVSRPSAGPLQAAFSERCRAGVDRLPGEEPLEILGQRRGRGVAAGSILVQAVQADRLHVPGNGGTQHPGHDRVILDDLADRLGGVSPRKGAAGQDLVEGRPQGVNVGRRPQVPQAAGGLLGSHVGRRAERRAAAGQIAVILGQLRQAEVGHARDQVRTDRRRPGRWRRSLEHDVARLQVAMEDPAVVRMLDGPWASVAISPAAARCGHRLVTRLEPGRERRTRAIGRDDVGDRSQLAGLVDRDDVRDGRGPPQRAASRMNRRRASAVTSISGRGTFRATSRPRTGSRAR